MMRTMRNLALCLAAVSALTAVDAAQAGAPTLTITGKIFYSDCVTPLAKGDTVVVSVYASNNLTTALYTQTATSTTPSYTINVDTSNPGIDPTKRYLTIVYCLNGATTGNRMVQGINVMGGPKGPRTQTIDIGVQNPPPGAAGALPESVTLSQGTFKHANGTTSLLASMGDTPPGISVTDFAGNSMPTTPVPNLATYGAYTIKSASVNPSGADKTLKIVFTLDGCVRWTSTGIVGGGRAQLMDIAFGPCQPMTPQFIFVPVSNPGEKCASECCLPPQRGVFHGRFLRR